MIITSAEPSLGYLGQLVGGLICLNPECRQKIFANSCQGWLRQLKAFARSLKRDQQAVVAALTYEWNNASVEGQANWLKLVKRAMYGRAKPDLLKARLLTAA